MVKFLKKCYVYLIFAFLYVPILVLMVYSFNDSRSRGTWGGLTLRWYVELFQDRAIMSSLYYTILIAVIASFVATVIGTLAALGIYNAKGFKKKLTMNLTYIRTEPRYCNRYFSDDSLCLARFSWVCDAAFSTLPSTFPTLFSRFYLSSGSPTSTSTKQRWIAEQRPTRPSGR